MQCSRAGRVHPSGIARPSKAKQSKAAQHSTPPLACLSSNCRCHLDRSSLALPASNRNTGTQHNHHSPQITPTRPAESRSPFPLLPVPWNSVPTLTLPHYWRHGTARHGTAQHAHPQWIHRSVDRPGQGGRPDTGCTALYYRRLAASRRVAFRSRDRSISIHPDAPASQPGFSHGTSPSVGTRHGP